MNKNKKIFKESLQFILLQRIYKRVLYLKWFWFRWLGEKNLPIRIHIKWFHDKLYLPLKQDHWEIYQIIHKSAWTKLRDLPNLIEPRDFNDRIQWLKLFDQSQEHIRCCDKLRVREYISERVGPEYLVELYQTCQSFDDINFSALPSSFVIKCNHDSGNVVLVRDKNSHDMNVARDRIEASLKRAYGWEYGEWMYSFVPRRVLVEKFLEEGKGISPSDHRFHCVNGEVRWVQVDIPFKPKMKEVTVNPAGKPLGVHFSTHKIYSEEFTIPPQWSEMIGLAQKLSKGWKYVRIDMFISRNQIFCGEVTFFPVRGYYAGEGQKTMGKLLNFDRTTFKPTIYRNIFHPV
jgi:hypothetical protein